MSAQPVELASERSGSRWINAFPAEDDIRSWFESQRVHKGMEHTPYLGGIVVIPATEKIKQTFQNENGTTFVRELERAVFTPYVKVDTRIAYFWDLVELLNRDAEEDFILPQLDGMYYGKIRPVPQTVIANETSAYYNANLPEGFTVHAVRENEQKVSRYLVATYEVQILRRSLSDKPDTVVLRGRGSKQTAAKRQYADDNAIMKAETGAIGRALGVAGILVVGTGVATAEDIQESMAATPGAGSTVAATLPGDAPSPQAVAGATMPPEGAGEPILGEAPGAAVPDTDEELRVLANELRERMQIEAPEAWATYLEWWKSRFEDQQLKDVSGPGLRGAVVKLQRDLDEATRS